MKILNFIENEFFNFVDNEITPKISADEKGNVVKLVGGFILRKSTKTFKAICELCRKGFGEDALILSRVLFEDSLNLQYICMHNEDERERLAKLFIYHDFKVKEAWKKKIEKLKQEGKCLDWIKEITESAPTEPNVIPDDSREEFESIFEERKKYSKSYNKEKYNNTNWNKHNWNLLTIKDTAEEAGEPYDCYYHFIYNFISTLTHTNPLGSFSYYNYQYDSESLGLNALKLSFDCYWRILFIIDKLFQLRINNKIEEFGGKYLQYFIENQK